MYFYRLIFEYNYYSVDLVAIKIIISKAYLMNQVHLANGWVALEASCMYDVYQHDTVLQFFTILCHLGLVAAAFSQLERKDTLSTFFLPIS